MRLDTEDELFGKWPPKKLIGSFWLLLSEVHEQAAAEIYQQVCFTTLPVLCEPHLKFKTYQKSEADSNANVAKSILVMRVALLLSLISVYKKN